MNRFPNSSVEIDENELFYFLHWDFETGLYHTSFVGWLRRDLVITLADYFSTSAPNQSCYHSRLNAGESAFIIFSNQPVYLVNYKNKKALEFAGDHNSQELFPSGNVSINPDVERAINLPSYWTSGVESVFEFKLDDGLFQNQNGVWIPLVLDNK